MLFLKKPFSRRSLLTSATSMAVGISLGTSRALAADPIRIGFGMSLTGPLAPAGKQSLLALEVWRDEVNAKGGLIGRPVQLVYYDDQSNPANVPSLYAKLIDVDKVDLLASPFATNQIVPAMPMVMDRKRVYMALFGTSLTARNPSAAFRPDISTSPCAWTQSPGRSRSSGPTPSFPRTSWLALA
jgi:branched-chain amino acid transport system substrate-binding protein